jgi:6-phosphogluconate dehydrogenase (decarboxylating)
MKEYEIFWIDKMGRKRMSVISAKNVEKARSKLRKRYKRDPRNLWVMTPNGKVVREKDNQSG